MIKLSITLLLATVLSACGATADQKTTQTPPTTADSGDVAKESKLNCDKAITTGSRLTKKPCAKK